MLDENIRVTYKWAMKLQQYLEEAGLNQEAFAKRIGRTQVTVSRLCSGSARPSLDLAFIVERATGGVVKAASWVDIGKSFGPDSDREIASQSEARHEV